MARLTPKAFMQLVKLRGMCGFRATPRSRPPLPVSAAMWSRLILYGLLYTAVRYLQRNLDCFWPQAYSCLTTACPHRSHCVKSLKSLQRQAAEDALTHQPLCVCQPGKEDGLSLGIFCAALALHNSSRGAVDKRPPAVWEQCGQPDHQSIHLRGLLPPFQTHLDPNHQFSFS